MRFAWLALLVLILPSISRACEEVGQVQILINEFLPDQIGSDTMADSDDEFVELYNRGTVAADVSGWTLHRVGTPGNATLLATLPPGTFVNGRGFYVVGGGQRTGAQLVVSGLDLGSGSGGDRVELRDCQGVRADSAVYGGLNVDALSEDDASVPTRGAPDPGEGNCLARRADGLDRDRSAEDFAITSVCSAGGPNPDLSCRNTTKGDVVINEILPNPAGPDVDAGTEFIELYNRGIDPVDLTLWTLLRRTSVGLNGPNESLLVSLPPDLTLEAGAYLVIGGSQVAGADLVVPNLDQGSGSGGDLVLLFDCEGTRADSILYGASNSDALDEDDGSIPTVGPGSVNEDACVARSPDGTDTSRASDDLLITTDCTPGSENPGGVVAPVCVPDDGSIALNEFLPNPAGTDADAATEFVELYNRGAMPLSVEGWTLYEQVAVDSAEDVLYTWPAGAAVPAGGFLVVGDSMVPEADFVAPVLGVPNGSGGDRLLLRDCEGELVDGVVFGPQNTDGLLDDQGIFVDVGLPDTLPDQCLLRALDGVDSDASRDWIAGYCTPGTTNDQSGGPPCDRLGGDVKINEFLPDPPGADADSGAEFVELLNTGASAVELAGWRLTKRQSTTEAELFVFSPGASLASGARLVLGGSAVAEADLRVAFDLGSGAGGDLVILRDNQGTVIDSVLYGGANTDGLLDDDCSEPSEGAPQPATDACVARRLDGGDTDVSRADFVVTDTCTPGKPNADLTCKAPGAPIVINELLPNAEGTDDRAATEFVELFSSASAPVDLGGWQLVGQSRGGEGATEAVLTTFPSGTVLAPGAFHVVGGLLVEVLDTPVDGLDLPNGSGGDGLYLRDCEGQRIDGVVYGGSNDDGVEEDDGRAPAVVARSVGEGACLGRLPDGADTNVSADDFDALPCSQGEANTQPTVAPPDEGPGCGCSAATTVSATGPVSGCSTRPGRSLGLLFAGLVVVFRRRR